MGLTGIASSEKKKKNSNKKSPSPSLQRLDEGQVLRNTAHIVLISTPIFAGTWLFRRIHFPTNGILG